MEETTAGLREARERLRRSEEELRNYRSGSLTLAAGVTYQDLKDEVNRCTKVLVAQMNYDLVLAIQSKGSLLSFMVDTRSYENTFRISFIKALYNEGKGLTVSSDYFQPLKASRKYSNKTDPKLMDECRKQLKKLGWEEKLLKFENIEMDCVLRCHGDSETVQAFAEPAKILLPSQKLKFNSPQPFTKKISTDSIVDGELPTPSNLSLAMLFWLFLIHL